MVLLVCLVAPPLVSAAEPSASERVGRLIRDLGSRRYAVRQQASGALHELGTVALPALKRATQDSDPEIRRHAVSLVAVINRRKEVARLLAATPVRLVCRATPVPVAVADLAKQSG